MVIQRSWKILSDTGSNSASSTEANKSPMGGLNSSSDDSNCSNQTTHSMVTSVTSPANNSVKIEALPAISSFTQNQNASSHQGQQNYIETTKYITTPQMAEIALQKLRQRFSHTAPLTSSTAESAMRSLELVRIAVQAQFDKEIDEMVKRFIETYFKPAFNNIKENLGQAAVNDDALQKMSCALLENAKSQYKTLRHKTQTASTTCNVISTLPNTLEGNTMRMALKRPALIKPTSSVMEMQKRFFPDPQQLQHQQHQLQVSSALGSIKSASNQQSIELLPSISRQDLSLQQPAVSVVSVQPSQTQNQQSHPRRQIFWNTANISIATKFVLDVQANQAFGFGTEGKERLASKHPELIRYLPDIEDRDWLISQQIIPQQNRNSRFLFLIYDEVCRLYHSNDQYKNKANVDLSIMMTFTVPDFLIQKMKLFFVDLNIKSRGLITNSFSMSSSTNLQPLQQSNSHLRNALLLGTSQSMPSSANATPNIPASIDSTSSPSVGSSSSPSSNIASVEAMQHQKFKSSNLSSSHATLTALLNNSSSSSSSASINSTNLSDKSSNSSANSLPNSSSTTPVIINKLRK